MSSLAVHRLPVEHFDALADGAGDARTARILLSAERSRRLLLLRAVLDSIEERPGLLGPLPGGEYGWRLLGDVQAQAPDALDSVLLHPQTGAWLAHSLRRIRGTAPEAGPPWLTLGHLHAVTLVAAARAGIDAETVLPVRDGWVALPTMGAGRIPGADAPAGTASASTSGRLVRLRTGAAEITLNGPDTPPGWFTPRLARLAAAGRTLAVWLEDVDPYRELADPVAPAPLPEDESARWTDLLDRAWRILATHHPDTADPLSAGLRSIVPLPSIRSLITTSASTGDAFGSALISRPPDPTTLAVALVHEFQHIKLGAVLHLVTLCRDDGPSDLYAPWRDDPRPPIGLLQGVYAFLGIAEFWRTQRTVVPERDVAAAQFEFAYARRQTAVAMPTLRASPYLTELGQRFAARLANRLRSCLAEPVPEDIDRLARMAIDDHRARWRLHHLRPAPGAVTALVAGWPGHADPRGDPDSELVPEPEPSRLPGRVALIRANVANPELFQMPTAEAVVAARAVDASAADLALVTGSPAEAGNDYESRIFRAPDDLDAWIGLAVAAAAAGDPGAAALRDRPELVRAVHTGVTARHGVVPVRDVARWLAGARPAAT